MHLIPRTIWVVARARRRPRAGLWEPTTLPMRALPTDVDMALHVNNGQYFGLFDLGRFDAMVRTGLWTRSAVAAGRPWCRPSRSRSAAR